jgi:exonuclease III
MRDTFRVARPDEPAYTFHAFRGPNARGRLGKIDYVLCDDRFTVEGAGIVRTSREGRLPSDHYPVTADLVLG